MLKQNNEQKYILGDIFKIKIITKKELIKDIKKEEKLKKRYGVNTLDELLEILDKKQLVKS